MSSNLTRALQGAQRDASPSNPRGRSPAGFSQTVFRPSPSSPSLVSRLRNTPIFYQPPGTWGHSSLHLHQPPSDADPRSPPPAALRVTYLSNNGHPQKFAETDFPSGVRRGRSAREVSTAGATPIPTPRESSRVMDSPVVTPDSGRLVLIRWPDLSFEDLVHNLRDITDSPFLNKILSSLFYARFECLRSHVDDSRNHSQISSQHTLGLSEAIRRWFIGAVGSSDPLLCVFELDVIFCNWVEQVHDYLQVNNDSRSTDMELAKRASEVMIAHDDDFKTRPKRLVSLLAAYSPHTSLDAVKAIATAEDVETILPELHKESHRLLFPISGDVRRPDAAAELYRIATAIREFRPDIPPCLPQFFGDEISAVQPFPSSRGGFADIYRGRWHGETVALKTLKISPDTAKSTRRFLRESLLWAKLNHPCILELYGVYSGAPFSVDTGQRNETLYMVASWMDNGNAVQFCRANPDADRVGLLANVAEGLQYLHNLSPPVIHGDLRGVNILITQRRSAVVTDFGLAQILQDHIEVSTSIANAGAVRWLAPELLMHQQEDTTSTELGSVTLASDVYSFGMTTLELLTGQDPFAEIFRNIAVYAAVISGARPRRPDSVSCPAVSDDIWALMQCCWTDNVEERPMIEDVLRSIQAARV